MGDKDTRAGDLLKSQLGQATKSHTVYDAEDRPVFIFTVTKDANDGDPCTVTELVYRGAGNQQVKDMYEDQYEWNSTWDDAKTFDPDDDIDPDGNGVL